MSETNVKSSHIRLVIINILLILLLLALSEVLLKKFMPFNVATIGHQQSKNALLYGWGFSPYETQRVLDPDTGETFINNANNHGWRDIDRTYDNHGDTYRILVLGDSVTYGAIVPAEKLYTRILENKLRYNLYNAEVISIGYGGWGTDQELEALINEGLKYKPNLIIVQFCKNDLKDNAYFNSPSGKAGLEMQSRKDWKPFYYELDQSMLLRKENPYFSTRGSRNSGASTKESLKQLLITSEIYKRIYSLYLKWRNISKTDFNTDLQYKSTDNKLKQLQLVIGLKSNSQLYIFLLKNSNKKISKTNLLNSIDNSEYKHKRDIILKVLEDRWFNSYWSIEDFQPAPADPESYEWMLYAKLIEEIKKHASSIDAEVAIFPETEEGHYQWSLSWYRVCGDERSKTNYLSHLRAIRLLMKDKGVDVIENTLSYERARNDPHSNIKGNEAMADDIYNYLMLRKDKLLRHSRLKAG